MIGISQGFKTFESIESFIENYFKTFYYFPDEFP
jgi:hypothetical protein